MTEELITALGITSDFDGALPYGTTAHSRTDGENVFVFLQNFNTAPVTVTTAQKWETVEKNAPVTGDMTLRPYETLILKRQK